MKIKVVGTGSITSSNACSSVLINDNLLIDCGSGIYKQLLKENVDVFNVETILITHLHADHYFDLPYFILNRSFVKPSNKLTIYGPNNLINFVNQLFLLGYDKEMNCYLDDAKSELVEFDNLNIDELNVKSVRVNHGDFNNSYGFKVDDLFVSGDSSLCETVLNCVSEAAVSILDCSFLSGTDSHMGVDNIRYLLDNYNSKIIPTHLSDSSVKELKEIISKNLILLEDGSEYFIEKDKKL